jgi:tetratricopeptide (TPR) repeat protein
MGPSAVPDGGQTSLLAEAMRLHREGRIQEAAGLCAQALAADPECAGALHLLGVIADQTGYPDTAAKLIGRAVQLSPGVPGFHNDLGVVYRKLQQLEQAAACYGEALRLDADFAEAHHNLGNLLRDGGQPEQAAECYRRALKLRPDHAAAWHGLGVCCQALGRADEAIEAFQSAVAWKPGYALAHRRLGLLLRARNQPEDALRCFQRVAELEPDSSEAHNNAGAQLLEMGKSAAAEGYLRRAVALAPDFAEAHSNLGKALRDLHRAPEAEACFREALRLRPDSAEALDDLGIALSDRNKFDESLACFEKALRIAPERPETHCNFGHALLLQDHFPEAMRWLREAIRLKPDFTDAWNNLGGVVLADALMRGDDEGLDEAERCFRRALEIKPDSAEVHTNLALLHLLRGRYEEGWREWEWRWRFKEAYLDRYPRPMWRGEPLEGRTILLHTEGGFGDTLQFVRYATLLRPRAGRVVLRCPAAVRALLSGCPGIDLVIDESQDAPWFDVHAPLMSLPGLLGTTPDNIPAPVPYILPDPDLAAFWRDRIGERPGFKVGIAWQGNPQFKGDRRRSIPLTCFEPLSRVSGVHLFSLQMGFGSEQLAPVASRWEIGDLGLPFSEKAAAMMSLDLIVTSDTAIAHLAGALGRPVWMAVCYTPDWRWFTRRLDSPWYPTMRLFRQPGPGQWPVVFDRMAACLKELVEGLTGSPGRQRVETDPG